MSNRTTNTSRNIRISVIGQFVNMILGFVSRKIFIEILTVEYLGLSGLFSNILTLLSITELGIGSAIICLLYKPLAENDEQKLSSIMALYKKLYFSIGCIIGIVGISLTPFLEKLIKDIPDIPHIQLIYIIYVVNSAISYFFCYKRELIIANQQRYIYAIYNICIKAAMYIGQIIVLLITHNYFLFLGIMLTCTVLENILISLKANKLFPSLKNYKPQKLDATEKSEIKTKIYGASLHKTGDAIINGTDSILISKIVGLVETGIYANYLLIINVINTFMTLVYNSILASVGNLGAEGDYFSRKRVFDRLNFITTFVFGFSSVCLLCLLNPFINIWIGNGYLFNEWTVVIIVLNFYLVGMRRPIAMMRDAFGIFTHDRYKVIPEVLINLVVSIFAGIKFGVSGIIIGTIISNLFTTFWTYPIVLYKYGLKAKVSEYYKKYFINFILNAAICALCFSLCKLIPNYGIVSFLIKLVISCTIPIALYFVIFHKNEEYKYFLNLLNNMLMRMKRKLRR